MNPSLSHIYCTYITTVQLSRQANALLSTISKTAKATAKAKGLSVVSLVSTCIQGAYLCDPCKKQASPLLPRPPFVWKITMCSLLVIGITMTRKTHFWYLQPLSFETVYIWMVYGLERTKKMVGEWILFLAFDDCDDDCDITSVSAPLRLWPFSRTGARGTWCLPENIGAEAGSHIVKTLIFLTC